LFETMEPFFEEGVYVNNLRDTTAPRNRWQPGFLRPEHPIHPSVRSSTIGQGLPVQATEKPGCSGRGEGSEVTRLYD
jgi:hypothetical protein